MFIHIGGDVVIQAKDVIAILNTDVKDSPTITKEFLNGQIEDEATVVHTTNDTIKSIVLTNHHIYLSPISSLTLKKRLEAVTEFDSFTDL